MSENLEEKQNVSGAEKPNKLMGALCYCSFLWVIPYFCVKGEERNEYIMCHLRQGLALAVLTTLCSILFKAGLSFVSTINLIVSVFELIGFIFALQGKTKDLPLIGAKLNAWFANLK